MFFDFNFDADFIRFLIQRILSILAMLAIDAIQAAIFSGIMYFIIVRAYSVNGWVFFVPMFFACLLSNMWSNREYYQVMEVIEEEEDDM